MVESVPMTREGYNKIKAEINRMENEEMPMIVQKIAEAREEGDLKENAEYHAQRENQGMLMAKINELRDKIARASIIDVSSLPKDEVVFGCTVTVEDVAYGDEEQFTLVGAGDEVYDSGNHGLRGAKRQRDIADDGEQQKCVGLELDDRVARRRQHQPGADRGDRDAENGDPTWQAGVQIAHDQNC